MNRVLIAVSCVLAALLLGLAVMQYRWAGRVAEADLERTLTQLRRAASLLAEDFDQQLGEAYVVIQNHGVDSLNIAPRSVRDLIASTRSIDPANQQHPHVFRLELDARLHDSTNAPVSLADTHVCSTSVEGDVPALIVPTGISGPFPSEKTPPVAAGCISAELNLAYLRETLFPSLIEKYFGKDAQRTYDFSVISLANGKRIFPEPRKQTAAGSPDVRQTLFSLRLENFLQRVVPAQNAHLPKTQIFIRSSTHHGPGRPPFDNALWELDIRNRSGPLASSMARWRQGNLLASLAVEFMLVASIAFLILAMRRMDLAARQKVQFVAGVSHELRTPVSAILMLSRNQADGLVRAPDQVRQYGTLIHQQSQRLSEMVEQTLEFAGIHSHHRKPELKTVDVASVVQKAVARRQPELSEAGFEIHSDIAAGLPPVLGDPNWLEEAVGNLLSNAMKYSKDHRWIRVVAAPDAGGREVAITVEDHGIGIDPSDQEKLFEPFYRGQRAVASQIPGSGLGLSLVRSAAEAHRGTITFSSEPDCGSSFTLRIPIAHDG